MRPVRYRSVEISGHDVKKPAARLGFGVFGDFALQTPKTRPPTPLGHRVFGCTKNHDLAGSAFEGVCAPTVPQRPPVAIRGEASPQALAQASGLAHRRSPNALGSNERSSKWQRNFFGAYVRERSAFSLFFGLSGRLGAARRVVRGWVTLTRRQQGWRTLATGALKRWIGGVRWAA